MFFLPIFIFSCLVEKGYKFGFRSEKEAQMCLYDASWDTHFGFCCDIDEETSSQLASKLLVLFLSS